MSDLKFLVKRISVISGELLRKKLSMKFVLLIAFLLLVPNIATFLRPTILRLPSARENDEGLGIRELIRTVKLELQETEEQGRTNKEAALFQLKDFDLEINFIVHSHSKGKAGVDYHFVAVGAETEVGLEEIQKIKLHMIAIPPRREVVPQTSSRVSGQPSTPIIHGSRPPPKKGGNP